ncbi:MAG: beta-lactamase family protein [Gammaproteobacteria bacterium]|nr:beta-lactamase family protein [Gammaproteobacteria bacterium]
MISTLNKIITTLFLLIYITGCGTLSTIQLDKTEFEAERYAQTGDLQIEVDDLAIPMVKNGHTPGVLVAVLTADGEQRFFSYGVADKITRTSLNAETLFPVGSLSKGYLGAITSMMVSKNQLAWDDTLESLLPEGTKLSDDAKKITLTQLATHTSGLPRQPMTFETLTYFIEYEFTGNSFYHHFDLDYILEYMADYSAPGEMNPQYSNIGYGLLSYIVELRSGKSLEQLLNEMILLPLNLTMTGYDPDKITQISNRATGYAGDHPMFMLRGSEVPNWEFTNIMKGSAAIHTTARDLLLFAQAHFCNDGSDYCSVLLDTLRIRYPQEKEAAAIAWIEDTINNFHITYQIGLVAGFTSYIGLDLENKNAVVVLQNSFNWGNDLGHRLLIRMAKAKRIKTSRNN